MRLMSKDEHAKTDEPAQRAPSKLPRPLPPFVCKQHSVVGYRGRRLSKMGMQSVGGESCRFRSTQRCKDHKVRIRTSPVDGHANSAFGTLSSSRGVALSSSRSAGLGCQHDPSSARHTEYLPFIPSRARCFWR